MLQRDYGDTNFLTSIRAVAILLVFLIHSGGIGLAVSPFGSSIVGLGKYGVQIFFVISGFTIFSQLFSEHYTLKSFLLVRISRISIPYFPIIIIVFILIGLGFPQFNSWAIKFNNGGISVLNLISHLLYLSSYDIRWQNTILGVEWTLGIEVFFYVLIGLCIRYRIIQTTGKSLVVSALIFLFISLFSELFYRFFDLNSLSFRWMPFRYSYMFYIGGFSFFLRKRYSDFNKLSSKRKNQFSDIFLVVTIFSFFLLSASMGMIKISRMYIEGYFVVVTFMQIVFFRNKGSLSFLLNNVFLSFLGSISFSFYLIHYPIILLLPDFGSKFVSGIIALVISIVFSVLWYYIFEKTLYIKVKSLIRKLV